MSIEPVRWRRLSPILTASLLFAGFAGLLVIWFSLPHNPDVPGLFNFPSVYFGDALLIPVAGFYLNLGAAHLPRARHDMRVMVVGAVFAAGVAAILQILWLADDHPYLNWTLPEAHQFHPAGVWHAAYSVVAAGLLTSLVVMVGWRARSALAVGDHERIIAALTRPGAAIAPACLFAYTVLAAHDSRSPSNASRTSQTALALAALCVAAFAIFVLGRRIALVGNCAMLAVIAAVAAGVAVSSPWSGDRAVVLGAATAGVSGVGVALLTLVPGRGLEADYREYRPQPAHVVLAIAILAASLPAVWLMLTHSLSDGRQTFWLWTAVYLSIMAIVPTATVRAYRRTWLVHASDVLLVFALFGATGVAAVLAPRWNQADLASLISLAVAAAIGLFLFPILWSRFAAEIDQEQQRNEDGSFGISDLAKRSATPTLLMLISAAVAAAFALLSLTLALAGDRRYLPDSGAPSYVGIVVGSGSVLAVTATLMAILPRRWKGVRGLRTLGPLFPAIWALILGLVGLYLVSPITPYALAGGILLALWAGNTALNNVALLRGVRLDIVTGVYVACVAASGLISGYFALSVALARKRGEIYTWFGGIGTAVTVLVLHAAIGVAAGVLSAPRTAASTRHGLVHNLVQDGAVMTVLYSVALVVPADTLLHVPTTGSLSGRLIATLAICAPLLAFFLFPYSRLRITNSEHLQREIATRAESRAVTESTIAKESGIIRRNAVLVRYARGAENGPEQHRFLRVLNAHIRNQNLLGAVAAAMSFAGILVILGGKEGLALGYLRQKPPNGSTQSRLPAAPPAQRPAGPALERRSQDEPA